MNSLNEQQKIAVETVNGPILILAGAGSGKTRTLTQRIAYLIQNNHATPDNILAVTFTNKAANEMKERIVSLLNIKSGAEKVFLPWVGTFHAICVQILKRDGQDIGISRYFSIYDTTDQKDVVRKALKKLNLNDKKTNPNAVLAMISSAKCELLSPEAYKSMARGYFEQIVAEVYPVYQQLLDDNSALDFDDLIMKTVELFQKCPEVLEKYQNIFKFILIDEYQDTNNAQYVFSKLLADKHQNICVVGDDAQSIYSFRGANITNILSFEKDYPDAKIIKLEQNYRSTKKILEASNQIISKNPEQKKKVLWTENTDGEGIMLYEAMDEKDEAEWISQEVRQLILNNVSPSEIAVLYRTNAMSRNLEEALLTANVNYRIVGGVRFYNRAEVKDVLGYLRILINPDDLIGLQRIINVPKRGVGAKTIEKFNNLANQQKKGLLRYLLDTQKTNPEELPKSLQEFARIVNKLIDLSSKQPVSELIEDVIEFTGYKVELQQTSEGEARLENIQELKSLAKKFDQLDYLTGLEKFLEEVALIESSYEATKDEEEHITLMTVHAAKGLEFEYVFIAGMEENLFPHANSKYDPQELAEERRLAYVAVTRAKKQVYVSYAESRMYFGSRNLNPLSRFIDDIPEQLLIYCNTFSSNKKDPFASWTEVEDVNDFRPTSDISKGDLVKHEIFGVGEVMDIDNFVVLIRFSAGLKELALEYVRLEKI